jgi:hypothetical protein
MRAPAATARILVVRESGSRGFTDWFAALFAALTGSVVAAGADAVAAEVAG